MGVAGALALDLSGIGGAFEAETGLTSSTDDVEDAALLTLRLGGGFLAEGGLLKHQVYSLIQSKGFDLLVDKLL